MKARATFVAETLAQTDMAAHESFAGLFGDDDWKIVSRSATPADHTIHGEQRWEVAYTAERGKQLASRSEVAEGLLVEAERYRELAMDPGASMSDDLPERLARGAEAMETAYRWITEGVVESDE